MRILASKYDQSANAENSLAKGDKATWTSVSGITLTITIDSDLMFHETTRKLGYESIFPDTGERAFANLDQLAIIRPSGYEG